MGVPYAPEAAPAGSVPRETRGRAGGSRQKNRRVTRPRSGEPGAARAEAPPARRATSATAASLRRRALPCRAPSARATSHRTASPRDTEDAGPPGPVHPGPTASETLATTSLHARHRVRWLATRSRPAGRISPAMYDRSVASERCCMLTVLAGSAETNRSTGGPGGPAATVGARARTPDPCPLSRSSRCGGSARCTRGGRRTATPGRRTPVPGTKTAAPGTRSAMRMPGRVTTERTGSRGRIRRSQNMPEVSGSRPGSHFARLGMKSPVIMSSYASPGPTIG